ncbi:MAG: head-tail connector protein [Holosporaceae bacterium]|nr:head-tail connector protein [Holosporaceae bacterium]
MHLNLIKKPSEEIISLAETKNYLRVDHDFDDNLISGLIKSTREAIESIIQKSILKQVWEYGLDNYSICDFDFKEGDYPSIFCGTMTIPLPKPPIIKIVSVEVDDREIDSQKYSLERRRGKFCLCINDGSIFKSRRKISISVRYEAGIADSVENIPYQLKLANLMLVANAFQERFSYEQNNVISQGVRQLLNPFLNLRIF